MHDAPNPVIHFSNDSPSGTATRCLCLAHGQLPVRQPASIRRPGIGLLYPVQPIVIDGLKSWTRSIGKSPLTPLSAELNPPPDIRPPIHGPYADLCVVAVMTYATAPLPPRAERMDGMVSCGRIQNVVDLGRLVSCSIQVTTIPYLLCTGCRVHGKNKVVVGAAPQWHMGLPLLWPEQKRRGETERVQRLCMGRDDPEPSLQDGPTQLHVRIHRGSIQHRSRDMRRDGNGFKRERMIDISPGGLGRHSGSPEALDNRPQGVLIRNETAKRAAKVAKAYPNPPCSDQAGGTLQLRGGVEKPRWPPFDCPLLSAHPHLSPTTVAFHGSAWQRPVTSPPGATATRCQDDHSQVMNDCCRGGGSVPGVSGVRSSSDRPVRPPPPSTHSSSLPAQCDWPLDDPR
ncbi:hypothetical protein BO94DRAFT_541747 [Aspergillus sclerotioniger CBS 115572]|uniref:Uncharacterized protein n=1 Tax=Aspergillus sclerotioniger CBS 115572 TaxID=1450535 RepID=A0A317XB50_9EURO|nr:hypothetical protein BO94DRAFT_541747 [Aspergillus sclerotioniger CBS 115572]PWY95625.1 hypothetical protein BO94DRAFT_541747 [Aspergillus sclerotioniger CBS 115572]